MSDKKILVVDDDPQILEFISKILVQHQYQPLTAPDSKTLFLHLKQQDIALIILDVMLGNADGIALCKQIRESSMVPIVLLTANTSEVDRVMGLEFGADDYIHKPFNPRELMARVQTILRRATAPLYTIETPNLPVYEFAGWRLDTSVRELLSASQTEMPLTAAEYSLLLLFLHRPKRVLSRDTLLTLVRKADAEAFDRSIDVLVSRLRRKLEDDPKAPKIIKTIHGGGYMFMVEVKAK